MPGLINFDTPAAGEKDLLASIVSASKAAKEKLDDVDDAEESDLADGSGDRPEDSEDDSNDLDDEQDSDDAPEEDDTDEQPDLSDVGALFVDGDVEAACKALGIDPKVLKVNPAKLEAMRKGLKEARDLSAAANAKEAANTAEKARLASVLADAKKRYGAYVDLGNAIGMGDFVAIQELVLGLAPRGTTWDQVQAGLANAGKTVTPGELAARRELKRLREEQTAREEAAAAATNQTQTAAQEQALQAKNLVGAETRLKGTPFEGITGAPQALVKLYADNWDYQRNGLKVRPEELLKKLAEDPVISQLVELKKLKGKKGGKPAAEAKPAPGRGRGTVPLGNTAKLDPKVRAERERQSAMVEAGRQEKAMQRGAYRGHRGFR